MTANPNQVLRRRGRPSTRYAPPGPATRLAKLPPGAGIQGMLWGVVPPATEPRPVYGGAPPVHRNPSGGEADGARAIAGRMNQLRAEVLRMVRANGEHGMTVKECLRAYCAAHGEADDVGTLRNSIGPRLTELKLAGLVTLDPTARRERCAAYVAVPGRDDEDGSICRRPA